MPPHSFIGHWQVTLFRCSTISLIIEFDVRESCYTLNNTEKPSIHFLFVAAGGTKELNEDRIY